MLNKLENIKTNTKNVSVYGYKEYELQELLSRFYQEINNCLEVSIQSNQFMDWAVKEGLPKEVVKEIKRLKENGDLEYLINETLFSNLNIKIDTNISKANEIEVLAKDNSLQIGDIKVLLKDNSLQIEAIEKELIQFNEYYDYRENKIDDKLIRNYTQELTLSNEFKHYDIVNYGKCILTVNGNIGVINGCINKLNDNDNYSVINPNVIIKNGKSVSFNTVGMNESWDKTNNICYFINKDGSIGLDKLSFNITKDCNLYISLNPKFNIVKEYVLDKHNSNIQHLINRTNFLINKECSVVVHAPDIHMKPYEDIDTSGIESYNVYTPKLINYINKNVSAFSTICNGDTMTESQNVKTKELLKYQARDIRRMFLENTVFVLGNHDDGSLISDSEYLTKNEFNNVFNVGKTGLVFNSQYEPYFVVDDTIGRCRHIILNSQDGDGRKIGLFKIGVNQIKWLINILSSTPFMSICIWCHTPLNTQSNNVVNSIKVRDLLSFYKNRNKGSITIEESIIDYDFSLSKGLISGVVSGHEHIDKNEVINGINYINDSSVYDKHNISNVVIDFNNRKINVLRNNDRIDLNINF